MTEIGRQCLNDLSLMIDNEPDRPIEPIYAPVGAGRTVFQMGLALAFENGTHRVSRSALVGAVHGVREGTHGFSFPNSGTSRLWDLKALVPAVVKARVL
jgi:hypothetical protein